MANFNGYDDVRSWLRTHDLQVLRQLLADGGLKGKSASVAHAYLTEVDEGTLDAQEEEEEGHGLKWHRWQVAIAAGVLVVPGLLVWAINAFRS